MTHEVDKLRLAIAFAIARACPPQLPILDFVTQIRASITRTSERPSEETQLWIRQVDFLRQELESEQTRRLQSESEVVRLQADLVSAQSQGPPAKPKKRKRFDQDPEPLPATDPTPATVHDFVAESDLTADHGLLFRLRELEKVIDSSATATTELASLSAVTHAASAIVDASTRLVRQCSTGGRVLPRTVDGARGTVVWSIEGVGAFRDKLADRTGRDVEDAVLQSRNTIRQKVSALISAIAEGFFPTSLALCTHFTTLPRPAPPPDVRPNLLDFLRSLAVFEPRLVTLVCLSSLGQAFSAAADDPGLDGRRQRIATDESRLFLLSAIESSSLHTVAPLSDEADGLVEHATADVLTGFWHDEGLDPSIRRRALSVLERVYDRFSSSC